MFENRELVTGWPPGIIFFSETMVLRGPGVSGFLVVVEGRGNFEAAVFGSF